MPEVSRPTAVCQCRVAPRNGRIDDRLDRAGQLVKETDFGA
jgi:hypothetical protein